MHAAIPRDGDRVGSALRCYEVGAARQGVLLLHPWWGLTSDVTDFADRLATAGFHVIAPDLFDGRTATTPEAAEQLVMEADSRSEELVADTKRALAHLSEAGVERTAAVGLSFGAAYSVILGAQGMVDAVVLYYGTGSIDDGRRLTVPVLGHFAADDPYEPDGGAAFFDGLRQSGAHAQRHRYPGTHHWFVEPAQPQYQPEAAELAWTRTLAFLRETLAE